ncbi:MAG TPA: histidine kinase [Streptosporangiaceae bacterium]|nr:histidine kinase [Streptosporangiaceae bacterium]
MSALYAWLRRHPMLVDGLLAAALVFAGVGSTFAKGMFLGGPLALGLAVPVVFRRKYPVAAYYTAVAAGGLQVALDLRPSATDVAILILLYTLAAYTPRRVSIWGLAVCLAGSAVGILRWISLINHSLLEWLTVGAMLFAGPALLAWVLGDSMRYRRAYYASLEDRAARLEAERDAQVQIAAAAERARIARELHDVIAHNVSVMVVQADGASYAMDTDPARAREALAAISATGRQALAEMRRLLGVLRREGDGASTERAPQPGMGELGELLDQARGAGLPVSFTVEGDPQPLPGGVALAAYRIVQESLTNTRKHAGPVASASVLLRYSPDAVVLTISDDGWGDLGGTALPGAPGAPGHGLTGMRERVAMYGGSVTAGPRPGGGFEVVATLPLVPVQAGAA